MTTIQRSINITQKALDEGSPSQLLAAAEGMVAHALVEQGGTALTYAITQESLPKGDPEGAYVLIVTGTAETW
jgi:hypothetical protein